MKNELNMINFKLSVTIIFLIFELIIGVILAFYPEKKRLKFKDEKFEREWKNKFIEDNPDKTYYDAAAEFHNKQLNKEKAHVSRIYVTDAMLKVLGIVIVFIIGILQLIG